MSTDKISRFWEHYIQKTASYKVPENALRWYVKHVEDYIKVHHDRRLMSHTPQDIETYFFSKGRTPELQAWQFKQIVHALRILFQDLIKSPWASEFPWDTYSISATQLQADHPTLARDHLRPAVNSTSKSGKGNHTASIKDSVWDKFQQAWPIPAEKMITVIRMNNYSIRSEQSYCHWMARFVAFHQFNNPDLLQENEIRQYLEHLVLKRGVSVSTQSAALNAIMFFYRKVMELDNLQLGNFAKSKKRRNTGTAMILIISLGTKNRHSLASESRFTWRIRWTPPSCTGVAMRHTY